MELLLLGIFWLCWKLYNKWKWNENIYVRMGMGIDNQQVMLDELELPEHEVARRYRNGYYARPYDDFKNYKNKKQLISHQWCATRQVDN